MSTRIRPRTGISRLVAVVVAVAAAGLVAGCGGPAVVGPGDGPNLTSPLVTGGPVAPAAPLPASAPTEVRIDAINATSSLVPLGLNPNRTITVPPVNTPLQASWYRLGPTPGAAGPAIILGHVNGNGKEGIFAKLNQLKPGDQVKVTRQDGKTAVFTVTKLQQIAKNTFPTVDVYGDTPDAQLRLITCGGGFDKGKGSYVDSIIAFATLTSVA
ncbi:MAG TPA: class F sortase [Pseudonocardia sp.]|uniref:class F sortase n=1 Tax=Pseudonocardia sp. TaxID=60912 RepID=UPI002ED8CC05